MDHTDRIPPARDPKREDPQRNLFWIFMSVIGVSMPEQGQQTKSLLIIALAALLFLVFMTAAILALFRFW